MSYPWQRYSKKLKERILKPRNVGCFSKAEADECKMHYVEAIQGMIEDGNEVRLYWLVDPSDGNIVDVKFQLFGQSALIGAADIACELLIGKNYDQAKRLTAELIDKQLRDDPDMNAFPEETYPHLNLIIDVIEDGVNQCLDLPLPQTYASPVPAIQGKGIEGWEELAHKKKLNIIQTIIDEEIRPYIELDAGGIEIVELKADNSLVIAYQGACTTCYSAIGGTLNAIQQIISSKVHPSLKVVPDMTALEFS